MVYCWFLITIILSPSLAKTIKFQELLDMFQGGLLPFNKWLLNHGEKLLIKLCKS